MSIPRWSRRRSKAKPRLIAFRASRLSATYCSRSSPTSASQPPGTLPTLPCSFAPRPLPPSQAPPFRSMVAGLHTEQRDIAWEAPAMTKKKDLTPLEAVNEIRDDNGQIVLVLQGGG